MEQLYKWNDVKTEKDFPTKDNGYVVELFSGNIHRKLWSQLDRERSVKIWTKEKVIRWLEPVLHPLDSRELLLKFDNWYNKFGIYTPPKLAIVNWIKENVLSGHPLDSKGEETKEGDWVINDHVGYPYQASYILEEELRNNGNDGRIIKITKDHAETLLSNLKPEQLGKGDPQQDIIKELKKGISTINKKYKDLSYENEELKYKLGKGDAVGFAFAFAEWVDLSDWFQVDEEKGKWIESKEYSDLKPITTKDLYQEYLKTLPQ